VQTEADQCHVGPLSRGHRPDLLDVDLARDHLVPEPRNDLRQQLEPLSPFVRNQDTQVPHLVGGHRRQNSAV
jgi:hypothetical protein